ISHLQRVSAVSWQGLHLEQVVHDTPAARDHFIAYAERGWLRSYLLLSGDHCIAFVIGMQSAGVFRYEFPGYDPAGAPYGPGKVLLCHILEVLHAHRRPEWFDFGTGDAEYKRVFGTESFETAGVYFLRRSAYMGFARAVNSSLAAITHVARLSVRR